ncbi:MAG: AMP-binding protein [Actinomycetota bacterium]|nr:AMP-binding protein [Actinomycetota bacterium]
MPLDRLRSLQERKLQSHLAYVWERSAFYRDKLGAEGIEPGDIHSLDDLARLPLTTKQELRDSQTRYPPLGSHAAARIDDVVRVHASSGTTGRPSYVGVTARDSSLWVEGVARCYYSQGVRKDSVIALALGFGFFVGGIAVQDSCEAIGATVVPVGTGASERIIAAFDDLGANQLTCTPSYATYLAEYLRDRRGRDPTELGVKRIFTGAEPGGGVPAMRARIEEDWGARVSESIGNADVIPVHSADCEERTGAHYLVPDFAILELIDPDTGSSISLDEPEAFGELVFTHIDRECVPLVRFRTYDLAVVQTEPCPCGRSGPRLRVVGRNDDLLIVRGVNVWPSAIRDVVSSLRPLTTGEIQILLERPPPLVTSPLRLKVEHGPDVVDLEGTRARVVEELRQRLTFTADAEIVPPGTLPRFEMKAKVIRKLYEEE